MAAGGFTSYNGTQRNRIARITTTGGLDTTFNPGLGANGTIWALALQSDGKMIVGGEFTTFNVSTRHYVARLNTNGVEDVTFDPGTGPNDKVYAVAVQSDGKVIIGGAFTMVGTTARNHIARLNADGTLDITFDPGAGADGNVFSLIAQTDGNILLGGDFNNVHGANSKCIARLTSNGSLDLGFLPGSGADDVVYSMNLQPDQKILITGLFRSYNQTRRLGIARLYPNGILDTTFMDNAYNHFAGLPRHYFNASAESPKFVLSSALQSDGKLLIGGFFDRVGGGRAREAVASRNNFTRLIGGSTPGPGNIELTRDSYTADENGESVFITMIRTNGLLGEGSVVISPRTLSPGPGAAVAGVDFSFDATTFGNPTWISTWPPPPETWEIQDGTFGQNQGFSDTVDPNFLFGYGDNDVFINMIDNNIIDGNRQLNLELNNPKGAIESAFQRFLVSGLGSDFVQGAGLGGENIPVGVALGRSLSSLTIVDNDNLKGVLSFIVTNYTVSEGTKFASVLVIRTNGSSGSVQVNYATSDGTATTPADYIATAGTLTFGPGVTNQSFQVQIVNDSIAEDDETINLTLLNPSGGATLGVANATLTIIDNDSPNGRLNFSASGYITNENAGAAIITVNRSGGSLGTITVQAAATNGTALSGTHFTAVTNTLTWNPGEITPKTFIVPLIDNALVDGNHTVNLRLFGSTVNGNATNIIGGVNNVLLTIVDDDAYGTVAFTRGNYYVKENGGFATVTVSRSAGVAQSVTVNFATLQFEATQGYDYLGTNGTFIFGPGEISKSFTVPILDNAFQDGNRRVSLVLSNANPPQSLGFPSAAFLTIVDDELFNEPPGSTDTSLDLAAGFNGDVLAMGLQPNGMIVVGGDFTQANNVYRNRIARLNSSGSLDPSFSYPTGGADGAVRALLVQSDGRIVIGGSFTNVNGTVLNRLARLNYGGSVDTTFNIGGAADNDVLALAETFVGGERRILAAGAFLNINGVSRPGIARVTETGGVDNGFAPGLGANGTVYAVLAYPTNSVRYGQVIIAGDFTTVGGIGRTRIARLNVDGTVDQSFNPGTGANDSVRALAFQTDERILIGGFFTNFNGTARTRIARLNSTGLLDNTFTSGLGANDAVASIAVQPDGRILLGGQFTVANGITRHRITRLFADGTPDPTINFGLGADSFISSVLLQPDDRILIGGGFTHFDEEPHARFARLYGRSITGSGSFEFSTAHYEVAENGTNALISVRRRGGTSGATSVTMTTSNGTAIAGVNYVAVNTNLSFPPGEILAQITIPIIDDFIVNLPRTVNLALSNPQPPNGPSIGNQANADLTIINDDSAVSFSAPTYSVNEDISSGLATLLLVRSGSTNGPLSVDFATTTNGTAVAGVNYLPVTNTFNFAPGETNQFVQIPVLHTPAVEGDKTVTMLLSNVVGGILLDPSQATLTLIDVEHAPGQFLFSTTNYFVNEGDSNAIVTIVRTNGRSGVVSVHFATADATAIAGLHYPPTNGKLTFGDG